MWISWVPGIGLYEKMLARPALLRNTDILVASDAVSQWISTQLPFSVLGFRALYTVRICIAGLNNHEISRD
ncbi:MAG: hypothetical protein C5S38_09485 [Candidatus Methanophagaceae archaeon]|nr:MAG: hypothetical protein C5S38_09485 [Methanophagales archaeon]